MTNTLKIKYDNKENKILYLKEYLFYTDEENQDLFIIFKFRNAYKQTLYAFEAEVTQYDASNNVLETSIFTYNNCEIRKKSDFVPYKKLHAYADCKSISIKIIYAKYSKKTFNEEYLANPNLLKALEKTEKKRTKKEIKASKKEIKASFKKNKIKNKNKFKKITMPLSFILILSVFFAFFYFQMINYEKENKTFVNENITYEIIGNEITVKKVDTDTKNVRIPSKLYSYNITEIGDNAFEGSNVEQVIVDATSINIGKYAFKDCRNLKTISSANNSTITLTLEAGAFKNCTSLTSIPQITNTVIESETFYGCTGLKSINLPNVTSVKAYAFENCTGLTSIYLENAVIEDNAFSGINVVTTDGLTDIVYKDSKSSVFGYMFGLSNEKLLSIKNINMKMENVSKLYFKGLSISNLVYDTNTFFEFGALENTTIESAKYELSDKFEVLNNEIISCNESIGYLVIDGSYTSILKNAISKSVIYSLTLNAPYLTYPANFVTDNSNVQKIVINCGKFSGGAINKNKISYEVSINVSEISGKFSDVFTTSDFEKIVVCGNNVTSNFFDKAINVNYLEISNEVETIEFVSFNKVNITSLTTPVLSTSLTQAGIDAKEINISGVSENPTVGFINGLKKVEKIGYYINEPSVKIPEYLVWNCSNLKELSIYSDNYKDCTFSLPLIGSNCPSLTNVSVPFIGVSLYDLTSYNAFNESAEYTERLKLTSQINSFSNLLENNNTLCELDIQNIAIYKSLNNIPESLETLVIRNSYIGKSTFNSSINVDNLVLMGCSIDSNSLDYINTKTLYVDSLNLNNYATFNRAASNIKYYNATNATGYVYGIQAEYFDNCTYNIVYGNNSITYNGFYIYNISSYMSKYLSNNVNCSLYHSNYKSKNNLFTTYSGRLNIFAIDNENIKITVINPIIVKLFDYYGYEFDQLTISEETVSLPELSSINNLQFIGWKDEFGNIINSGTTITSDCKLYPIYEKKLEENKVLSLNNTSYYYSTKYDVKASINVFAQDMYFGDVIGTCTIYKNGAYSSIIYLSNYNDYEIEFNANDVYRLYFNLYSNVSSAFITNKVIEKLGEEEVISVNITKYNIDIIEYSEASIFTLYKDGYVFIGYYDKYGTMIFNEYGDSVTTNYPDVIIARYDNLY